MSLTPPQIRAAELLAKGHSQQSVGDQVGVSRRTILRWLKQEDFRNLSFGLVGRVSQSPQPAQPQPHQRSSQTHRQSGSLRVEDLVPDVLETLHEILTNPEARTCDRLKAAALIGEWAGLGADKKMAEMEALKLLIDANWVPDEVLVALVEGSKELEESIKNAFQNGNKKALLQSSEEGTFDDNE
jgi:hypothetical protein